MFMIDPDSINIDRINRYHPEVIKRKSLAILTVLAFWLSGLMFPGLWAQEGTAISLEQDEADALSNAGTDSSTLWEGLDPLQKVISQSARKLIGRKNMVFANSRFTWDCSGTVMACLMNSGMDLRKEYGQGDGNGVNRLFQVVKKANLDYDPLLPEIGDLIFFDNTYDKNGNLEWDDPLTHVAVVVDVDNDGTITYLHHDYRRGVVLAYMNLLVPDVKEVPLPDGTSKTLNSPLRMNKDRYLNPSKWLSSHLFRSFGRIRLYTPDSGLPTIQVPENPQ